LIEKESLRKAEAGYENHGHTLKRIHNHLRIKRVKGQWESQPPSGESGRLRGQIEKSEEKEETTVKKKCKKRHMVIGNSGYTIHRRRGGSWGQLYPHPREKG